MKDYATSLVQIAPLPGNTGTVLYVQNGHGVRFPDAPFKATVHPALSLPTLDNAEKVLVTAKDGDKLTIQRALSPTTAKYIQFGYRISNSLFAEDIAAITGAVLSVNDKTGVVTLDKNDVGLGMVDNTSDASKPVSLAVQGALNNKEGTLPTGTTAQYFRGNKTLATLDKTAVGLPNVDNTSDANKPVSTAAQTALNTKVGLTNTETITGSKTITARTRFQANNTDFGTGAGATGAYVSIGNAGTNNSWFDSNGSSLTDVSHNYRTKGAGTHNFLVGEVRVPADPTVPLAVATKQYVDNQPVKGRYATATVGLTSGDYPVSSYANTHNAVNAAINAVNTAGGGEVRILKGSYPITGQIIPKSNVRIIGEGVESTVLTGGVSSGYTFAVTGTGGVSYASIENLTIDTNNVGSARGIRLEYATNIVLRNLHIKNTNGWMIAFSTTDGLDTNYRNTDILIDNVFLDSKTGSIGALLFNNCQRVRVTNSNVFSISGPGIELYQWLDDIKIINTLIRNTAGAGAYYSLTTDNITFSNCTFLGGQLQGANQPDNGAFGQIRSKGIKVDSCYFKGNSTALQIGAVDGMIVSRCTFENSGDGAIYINSGNAPVNAAPINWTVSQCIFKNNNQNNNLHTIHPAIYFQNVGNSQYGTIKDNKFYDDQTIKTQRYPIVFDGAFTWENIVIRDNRLLSDIANSGTSIRTQSGAVLGNSVLIVDNQDYNGTSSISNICY